jgi:hypothetical protein
MLVRLRYILASSLKVCRQPLIGRCPGFLLIFQRDRLIRFFSLILIVATVTTCSDDSSEADRASSNQPPAEDPDTGKKTPGTKPAPAIGGPSRPIYDSAYIQDTFVAEHCLSCHESATQKNRCVDLHDVVSLYTNLAANDPRESARKVIRVGCPNESLFYSQIKNGEMPPRGIHPIAESDKKMVYDWIVLLAPQGAVVQCSDEPSGSPLIGVISQ